MDPTNTELGRMLTEEITPVVMVLRTPQVEEACQKNGLNFNQMLSPFSVFDNIDVPVRTASDQPYRLQKFKLRFFYASDIHRPNLEAAKERLSEVVSKAGEAKASDLCSASPNIENILANSKSGSLPSWFQVFNKELSRTTSFSDHETFDHPVACLLVVSSNDEDPIHKFADVFNTSQLPSILNDGVMDPTILKHYLLLHDNKSGPAEIASQVFSEMKNTFGANDCRLLCINSNQDGSVETEENPWTPDHSDASASQSPGCFLNVDDIDEIKLLIQDLSTKHIIPYMEQKIRLLNQQVSATRKGFRNQIKNLWWRKGREETQDSPDGPMYTYSSTESQIRLLGDYAFMLRDYELALSNYRLISTDYKIDKAWKRYAGVQEIIGLAYFMLDQTRRDAESCMETAFTTYLNIGLNTKQNAMRCGLWWIEMLKAWELFKEAANVYFRISGEDPLLSAVMLEQASYCYLFAAPPMLRKYGFHLVMSGDQYRKRDQMKHAIRTYRTALSVFKGTSWGLITNHIHFQLGRWFASLGMYDVAIGHMLETLACTDQSMTSQELFLQDFIQVVQKIGKTFEVWKLQLPAVRLPTLRVVFEDHRTYASPAAVAVKESVWQNLEEDIIPSLSNAKANWLELQTKLVPKRLKQSNICVAGEAIKVDIGFKNPLQIPISISCVSLICQHFASTDDVKTDENNSASDSDIEEELRKLLTRKDITAASTSFTLSEADFTLGGSETLVVQLTVTPRVEGILKIVGVKWKLSCSVVGFQNFDFSQIKKSTAKGRRKLKHSPNSLQFLVIKSLPRLEGCIRNLPKRSYLGELHLLVLELKSQLDLPVKNVKMKISCPRFLIGGDRAVLDTEFPACLLKEKSERSAVGVVTSNEASSFLQFPEDLNIQGKHPFTWPLWLRSAVPGVTSLYLTIYYEVGDQSSIMKYRMLRMCYNLEVLPSLDVSFQVVQGPSRSQEVLLRMDVGNNTSSESFQVQQLSAIGDQWQLEMLQPADTQGQQIMVGQASSCFFKLKNVRKPAASDDLEPLNASSCVNHVRLATQTGNSGLFDINSEPLADFHSLERIHQQTFDEAQLDAVDLVLIYQPRKSREEQVPDHSRLFAHYSCHCSVARESPIYWRMEGPRTIHHDFSSSFCEVNLKLTVRNSLASSASVRISTYDSSPSTSQPSGPTGAAPENRTGWHDTSSSSNVRVPPEIITSHSLKQVPLGCVTPFIWSGSSSTRVELRPSSSAEVPLKICVFAPGTYDLSSYNLHWDLISSEDQIQATQTNLSSGTCPGHSFFITVLQSA